MTWFGYAILSLLAFSAYEVMARFFGVKTRNPVAFSVIYNLLICLYFLPLFLVEPFKGVVWTWQLLGWTLVSVTIWTVFVRFEYFAHREVEATTLAVVLKIAPVITFGVSILFLNEVLTSMKLIGIGLILLANIILFSREQRGGRLSRKGLLYALVVMISLGLAWVMDKVVAPWYGVVVYSILSCGPPAIINTVSSRIGIKDLIKEWQVAGRRLLVLPVFTVVGYFGLIKALTLGEASRVVPVATATAPMVMLLAVIFLKETRNIRVKLLVVLLTAVGIWCMS